MRIYDLPVRGPPTNSLADDTVKRPRTFRVFSIPGNVTVEMLRAILTDIDDDPGEIIISLVRETLHETETRQTATITFTEQKPSAWEFRELIPGRRAYWKPEGLKCGVSKSFTVDCDFDGITPLYSDVDPNVELVISSASKWLAMLARHTC
jgi:hypothetical protein